MFTNIKDFTEFKAICVKENIEFHTYTVTSEKTLTAVLKSLIRPSLTRITENIRCQGLNLTHCVEIPTHTKYPIYRVTFASGIIYWEKYESHKPTCFRKVPSKYATGSDHRAGRVERFISVE